MRPVFKQGSNKYFLEAPGTPYRIAKVTVAAMVHYEAWRGQGAQAVCIGRVQTRWQDAAVLCEADHYNRLPLKDA